jgi:hypothetical protein
MHVLNGRAQAGKGEVGEQKLGYMDASRESMAAAERPNEH